MARLFHASLGIALLLTYIYVVSHQERFLPGLAAATQGGHDGVHFPRASRGLLLIYGLPLAAAACFIAPERLKWWLSPRTPPDYDYLLGEPFWYLIGYLLVGISAGLFALFR